MIEVFSTYVELNFKYGDNKYFDLTKITHKRFSHSSNDILDGSGTSGRPIPVLTNVSP